MVLGLFGGSDVSDLIARRKYAKAIELIRVRLAQGGRDPRLRMQLADVLIMSGREREAVPVLIELADEHASEHEAPKAIALLKKIERIEPGRSDVAGRLASLIKERGKPRARTGYTPRTGIDAAGYEPAGALFTAEHFEQKATVSGDERVEAARNARWVPSTRQEEPPSSTPGIEIPPEPEETGISDEALRGQILDVIQEVLQAPEAAQDVDALAAEPTEIPESPLFSGFSHEELVAVMDGLRLRSFAPGDVILTEGTAGNSLFVVTEGTVKAFVRSEGPTGQRLVRTMGEGEFFGEISILSGKPRTATVTAATACELLELDRATLDDITRTHPGARKVLEDFYVARAMGDAGPTGS